MSRQLPADCLSEIFEYLDDDRITLRSCLLVNHTYCEVSVRILWRNVLNFQYIRHKLFLKYVPLSIISTLIACLPNESKDLLHKNGIYISTPTSKPPLFNYPSFCKYLSVDKIDQIIEQVLQKQPQSITSGSFNYNKYLLSQEILKMFMKQISSLKSLNYCSFGSVYSKKVQSIMFTYLPEAKNCLIDLKEFNCSSDIYSEFFFQISQICHNIQFLTIDLEEVISDGLTDLISLQNNLKSISLHSWDRDGTGIITSSLAKSSLTLTKLKIEAYYTPLSFISMFINLQELILSLESEDSFDDFNQLQYVIFPKLKILKLLCTISRVEMLIKFLETNGKNLMEFSVNYYHDNLLNLAIAEFCPNLKKLSIIFMKNELETLKLILNKCQYLENFNICGDRYLNSEEFLKILVKYLPKNFYELEINFYITYEGLEEFFINWKNRIPQKSLSLIITNYKNVNLNTLIEKYIKLGVIKKFKLK
ncbi:hypothetical protein C1645_880408 [Glomus cerebriforme]|uniref:F-box domain-containing protein n=1 Tax=Glomus cerebriforme TaxID=658196 RepID=A0A397SFF7_9GLOM|nr:hypothetical protein C1645_880408 [Glomus cerebriforme]